MKTEFADVKLQTKQCSKCGWIKPLYEFYGPGYDTKDGHQGYCIDCQKKQSRNSVPHGKAEPAIGCRKAVIDALGKAHIFATTGKSSPWTQIDVVAWGCVRIRAASSALGSRGKFLWGMDRRGKYWNTVDLVILVCDWGVSKTYHVFCKDDPLFFIGGKRKAGICFNPSPAWEVSGPFGPKLTAQIMKEHENKWSLIEAARLANAVSLAKVEQ